MRLTEKALHKYFRTLLETPRIQKYVEKYKLPRHNFVVRVDGDEIILPRLRVVKTAGVKYAGMAHSDMVIDISRWILEDKTEAKGTLRHEVAHLLHVYSKQGGDSHGKEFTAALKIVSPTTWRKDRHWHPNPIIEKARIQVHPTAKVRLTSPLVFNNTQGV